MENDDELKAISIKLNAVISLLMDLNEKMDSKTTTKEKVAYLVRTGLNNNQEISKILGISEKHVSKEKAMVKKDGREETV
jgi:DNA-binding NarL/FixJ family response regulator